MEGRDGGWWGVLQLDDNLCDGRLKQMVVVSGQGRMPSCRRRVLLAWFSPTTARARAGYFCVADRDAPPDRGLLMQDVGAQASG